MHLTPTLLLLAYCAGTPDVVGPQPEPEPTVFAGSSRCAECHSEIHALWKASHHHLAETADTIGVAPLQQRLVKVERGRIQVSQEAWDPAKKEYFDVFDDGRQEGEWGHWTGRGMTWNSMCAACHNTGLTKGYNPLADAYDTQRAERGVGCESCHGKGSAHVDGGPALTRDPGVDTCGSCHARRASLTEDFAPGDAFLDHYAPALPDLSDVFWADGQVRDEDFEFASFLSSKMYSEGVTCVDCHDPHSGELKRDGDALCLSCHETQETFTAHDNHVGAVSCVDCHMPTTVYMQRHPRRDHGFKIPDPGLTAELGIPNACDRCHDDTESPSWANPEARPHRNRARALSAARGGDPTRLLAQAKSDPHPFWQAVAAGSLAPWAGDPAVVAVLDELARHPDPLVRFAAAGSHPGPVAMKDELRAVRVQSQRATMGTRRPTDRGMKDLRAYLEINRDQPGAAVELGNWWLVSGNPGAGIAEIRRAIVLDPGSAVHRGSLARGLAQAGRGDEALRELKRSVADHPDDAELLYLYALSLSDHGRIEQAAPVLDRVVELEPNHARAWYNLGIARRRLKDIPAAIAALERSMALDPSSPDAADALRLIATQEAPGSSGRK